jgi:hypothetical protein
MIALASRFFGNHFKLVDGMSLALPVSMPFLRLTHTATGNFVPSPSSLLRSIRYPKSSAVAPLPSLSTNPFSLTPLAFAFCLLVTDFWIAVCVFFLLGGGWNVEANDGTIITETNNAPLI